jgi:cytochrome c-type protein NapC
MKKVIAITVAATLVVAGLFTFVFTSVLEMTNETEFCVSCHSMKINHEEYQETVHYKNASGVRASCADCHVPKSFFPKLYAKIYAAKDVYHEFIGDFAVSEEIKNDPEKYKAHYEERRWAMANAVWDKMKANDSATCRSCHTFEAMKLEDQSKSAAKRHAKAMEEGKTCIDCHKGIAHHEPSEPEEKPQATSPATEK